MTDDNNNNYNTALEVLPKKFNFDEPPRNPPNKLDHRKNRRPLLFTPVRKKKIVTALSTGASVGTAAGYAGISKDTLKRWISRGQDAGPNSKGPDYALYQFSEKCIEASSTNALGYISIPNEYLKQKSADGELDVKDASLALDVLKVLHREEYGTKKKEVKHDHSVRGGVEVKNYIDLSSLTITQLKQLRDISKQLKEGDTEDIVDAEIVK